MQAKRPFVYLAICGALLGGAVGCSGGGSPTGATALEQPDTPEPRDTSAMIPPSPFGGG